MLNLLVVVAGSFLLITRRYPGGLFDLLVGVNRWLYRVLTYVALMHDAYPPFRLDQGQLEPDSMDPSVPAAADGGDGNRLAPRPMRSAPRSGRFEGRQQLSTRIGR